LPKLSSLVISLAFGTVTSFFRNWSYPAFFSKTTARICAKFFSRFRRKHFISIRDQKRSTGPWTPHAKYRPYFGLPQFSRIMWAALAHRYQQAGDLTKKDSRITIPSANEGKLTISILLITFNCFNDPK